MYLNIVSVASIIIEEYVSAAFKGSSFSENEYSCKSSSLRSVMGPKFFKHAPMHVSTSRLYQLLLLVLNRLMLEGFVPQAPICSSNLGRRELLLHSKSVANMRLSNLLNRNSKDLQGRGILCPRTPQVSAFQVE